MACCMRDVIVLGMVTMVTQLISSARSDEAILRPLRSFRIGATAWTNGVVPYTLANGFPEAYKKLIIGAMREIESNTGTKDVPCITFRPFEASDYNYLDIIHPPHAGCHASVGMGGHGPDGRAAVVGLSLYCKPIGNILHQLMHALGFIHEHQRPDRDSFIDVHQENVRTPFLPAFDALKPDEVNLLGTDYDYRSVLHYGPFHAAKSTMQPAMTPKAGKMASGIRMGRARYMSVNDVTRVQRMYGCAVDTSHIVQRNPSDVMIDCDFENGDLCQFTQDNQDNYDWIIGQDNVGVAGIIRDYTRGNGKYIYARTDGTTGDVARLNSPQFPKGKYCLVYALYMYGNHTSNLLTIVKTSQKEDTDARERYGSGYWAIEKRNIDVSEPWSLVLEYKVGLAQNVDVALDDVELLKGECGDRV